MAKKSRPRFGSLQYWPRKRVERAIPRVNWAPIKEQGLLGFITYKVGMASALVQDNTPNSMTKGKKIFVPVTVLEAPKMKIFSVRFYKDGIVKGEIVVSNDKLLKKKVKVSKELKHETIDHMKDWNDVRVIAYSVTNDLFKKTPDLAELGINAQDKIGWIKSMIGKEISLLDVLKEKNVDARALTRGKGLVGPVKRFGIELKQHKTEKGLRRPGSLGPWHPARVTFRVPMAGQLGMFTRVTYNLNVLKTGKDLKELGAKEGFKNYGLVKNDYLLLRGSVQGPPKRQVLITKTLRASKKQAKKNYEFMELKL